LIILKEVFVNIETKINGEYREVPKESRRSAFVFITAKSDCAHLAFKDLKKIQEVAEVYLANGAYDIVAKIKGESVIFLIERVLKRIEKLSSVKSTLTLTVV
jgi:DNA-binding Lrp family transcriptional regulator